MSPDRLVTMANQIGQFFASQGEDEDTETPDPWGPEDRLRQQQENDEMMAERHQEWLSRQ